MHRGAVIAVLAAAVLVPGSQAQMRSGGVRGAAPSRGAMRSMAPARGGFAPGMPAGRHFGGAPGFHGAPGSHGGFRPGHHHFLRPHRGYISSGCFNGSCSFGYAGYPAYYVAPPIFYSGFDYGPAYDYAPQSYAAAAPAYPAYDDSALRLQIQRLTDEVEQLREEQQEHSRAPQAAPPTRPSRMDLPTILVFRDGRVKEVQNYGIVGQTLWIFDEQRARKVPLSELDLAATKGANDDRGGFVVPVSR